MRKPTDLTALSAAKLHAEIAKREARHSVLLDEVIAAGYGNYTGNQIRAIIKSEPWPLLVEHEMASDALYEARSELDQRKRYHGGDKPIKRRVYA